MALRIPSPVALTKPEAYLAYKAGILSRGELKDKLLNPINNYEGWLAKWCELLETYPTNKDGTPQCLTDEEGLLAYLCGVTDRYPATNSRPDDARISAYIRYLVSARYARPDHPLNREEFYLSLIKTQFIPSGDPSSDIVIDGTTKAPFVDVKAYGDTLQNSYSGKNLWNGEFGQGQTYNPTTTNRITTTQSPALRSGQTYTVSAFNLPSGFRYAVALFASPAYPGSNPGTAVFDSGWKTSESFTFTPSSDCYFAVVMSKTDNTSLTPSDVSSASYQLELGSTATSYEPYVGGIPAPNPEYPQPISVVTGENTVKVVGKNLMPLLPDGTITTSQTLVNGVMTVRQTWAYNKELKSENGVLSGNPLENTGTYYIWYYRLDGLEPNTTYTLSLDYSITMQAVGQNIIAETVLSNMPVGINTGRVTKTIITDENGSYIPAQGQAGKALLNLAIGNNQATYFELSNIQLELGSTATTYEPYQGQEFEVNLGKNLFDKSTVTAGYRIGSDGSPFADSSFFLSDYIRVNASAVYAYSRAGSGSNSSAIAFYKSDKTFISRTMPIITNSATSGTVTSPAEAYYARICDTNANLDSAQLELGSQATSYSEYFTPIELAKIGTYQDRIYKEGEKWYVEKQVGKAILNGTANENVTNYDIYGNKANVYAIRVTINGIVSGNTSLEALSDKYHIHGVGSWTEWYQTAPNITLGDMAKNSAGTGLFLSVPSSENSLTLATAWLANNPAILYYQLATPTVTEITNQSLIDQLNALKQGGAEEGTTYIRVSATDPNLPAKLYVEAPKYD